MELRHREVLVTVCLGVGVLVMIAIGAHLQNQVHLNHDVGWITHSARWLLEGRRFGSGVVDPNPPLIWFISLPAAALAKAGWMSEQGAIRAYLWVVCVGSLWLSFHFLRVHGSLRRSIEAAFLVLGASYAVAIVSTGSFAQREFLSFILGLPYCALVAARLEHRESYSRASTIAAGLLAGVAFGFKPWLLAVPLTIELVYLGHTRDLKRAFRPETLALCAFLVVYVVGVALFTDYLTSALPLIRAVYWAYEQADAATLWSSLREAFAPAAIGLFLLAVSRIFPMNVRVLLAALVGFSANYWLQRKGFGYHLFPVVAVSLVILCYSSAVVLAKAAAGNANTEKWLRIGLICTAPLLVYGQIKGSIGNTSYWLHQARIDTGEIGRSRQALIDRLNELVDEDGKSYVYAFSTHPYPGFPTMNYVNAEWASAYPCQFVLPAHFKRQAVQPEYLHRVDDAVLELRQKVLDEFIRYKPQVVLVNASFRRLGLGYSKFDDVAFYNEDPRFSAIWRHYREIDGVRDLPSIKIFTRRVPADQAAEHASRLLRLD